MDEKTHVAILNKFHALKGEILYGRKPIKGIDKENRVPPDQFVDKHHILHDLIRGFYKPKGMPYLLSYQATESAENYGEQIRWINKNESIFERIEMRPPSSERDLRKVSDIKAARYNLENQIPLGVLQKVGKGINKILGLGLITKETEEGIFIVEPFNVKENEYNFDIMKNKVIDTEIIREVILRQGQQKFKNLLLKKYTTCAMCNIHSEFSRASHIKPWSESEHYERLDVENGLLLCPNHDYLFDQGYISFNATGNIMISSSFPEKQKEIFNIDNSTSIQINERMDLYMQFHRGRVFKR